MSNGWDDADWGSPQDDFSWDSSGSGNTQNTTDWGTNQESDNWNSTNTSESWDTQSQQEYWENQESNSAVPESNIPKAPIKVGSKTVAIILACCFLVVALVLVVISNVGNKKPAQQPVQQQQQSNTSGHSLIQIPNNIALDYSGKIYSTNASVRNKVKYKDGNQVVYCIELNANFGSTTEVWNYYCSYNAYCSVKIGDVVFVDYQTPQEGYVSIMSVSK